MLTRMVNLNGIMYNTVGMVKLNNGAFLLAENQNQLINLDFTRIPNLSVTKFEIKKPTKVELVFINYIQTVIQDKINNGEITNLADLTKAISNINGYVNKHDQLLNNMKELDNKDDIVESLKENLLDYFAEEMNNNQYFQTQVMKQTVETPVIQPIDVPSTEETVETVVDPINIEQPFQVNQDVSVELNDVIQVPEYDEQAVNTILYKQSEMPDPNFNMEGFVKQYFSSLTNNQIDLLLSDFNLSEQLKMMLQQRKETLQVFNSLEKAEVKQNETVQVIEEPTKRKKLLRNAPNNKGQAAFVDTLLLSFTVGTICGVYLMYFVLTIMS